MIQVLSVRGEDERVGGVDRPHLSPENSSISLLSICSIKI